MGTKATWITLSIVATVGVAAAIWLPPAEAQLGGYSQVTRLELRYTLGEGALDARFHLASGLAVDQRIDDESEIGHLLQAAEIQAAGKARMFATVASDRVSAWHLSVP